MARRKKQDPSESGNAGHNSASIKEVIAEVAGEVIRLKGERAAVSEQITEARARLKGFGIKMADFNAALRYYELEHQDRDSSLDNLKLCFEALGMGEQLDFISATAKAGSDDGDVRPNFLKNRTAEKEGEGGMAEQERIAGEMDPETGSAPAPTDRRPRARKVEGATLQ